MRNAKTYFLIIKTIVQQKKKYFIQYIYKNAFCEYIAFQCNNKCTKIVFDKTYLSGATV